MASTHRSSKNERKSFVSKYSPIICQLPDFRDSRRRALWRHSWEASDQFSMQLGADCVQSSNVGGSVKPWVGVRLLQDPERPDDGWAVEVNTDFAVVQCPTIDLVKPFRSLSRRLFNKEERTSGKKVFEIPVNLKVGTDFFNDNAPHIEIGVKNKAVIFGMLICSLALQKPMAIHVKRKEVGLGSYDLSYCPGTLFSPGLEIDGQLKRQGWQIMIQLDDLVPVLRTSSSKQTSPPPSCCCCSSSSSDGTGGFLKKG